MTTAGKDAPSKPAEPPAQDAKAPVVPAATVATCRLFRRKQVAASVEVVPLPADENRKAIYAWAAEEIKQGSSRMYDVGKFVLTIATGTGGAFVTFYTGRSLYIGKLFLWTVVLHVLAMISGLLIAWPRQWRVGPDTDLYGVYANEQRRMRSYLWAWLVTWLAALACAGYALYKHPPA